MVLHRLVYNPSSADIKRMKGIVNFEIFQKLHFAIHETITRQLEDKLLGVNNES